MPHRPGHGTQRRKYESKGLGSKPDTSAYKQAAQSMKAAGIKSLSGATTPDEKGKQAKQKQEDFRNQSSGSNNNNQSDPIVPKKKPPPDEEKKDFEIIAPGKDPDRDDRPKSKGLMKSDTKPENVFGLEYNMDLSLPSTVDSFGTFATTPTTTSKVNKTEELDSMVLAPTKTSFVSDVVAAIGEDALVNAIENPNVKNIITAGGNVAKEMILKDNGFVERVANFVDENIPETVKNTVGASYIIANAAITGDLNLKRKLTDNIEVEANVEDYGKNMRLFIGYSTEF